MVPSMPARRAWSAWNDLALPPAARAAAWASARSRGGTLICLRFPPLWCAGPWLGRGPPAVRDLPADRVLAVLLCTVTRTADVFPCGQVTGRAS